MSTDKEEPREEVTLKKTMIQGDVEKKAGQKIKVRKDQKERLAKSGHI